VKAAAMTVISAAPTVVHLDLALNINF